MPETDRMTITLPPDIAETVKGAVEQGEFASDSAVVREALLEWRAKRALEHQELASLKADIDRGMTDLAEGIRSCRDLGHPG